MPAKVTWSQALAWRMRRHELDPVGNLPVTELVRRLCGVQAQVASSAELAIRVRRTASRPGEAGAALANGSLVKTWAMRGTLHLLNPAEAGVFLSVIASARSWERPSWQRYFAMTPAAMESLRGVVREALDGRALTREQLIDAVTAKPGLEGIAAGLRSGWGTLLKPLAWQGDLCFGPSTGNRVTFMRPEAASASWMPLPDPDEAAPRALVAYLASYGPASVETFARWLAGGWFGVRQLRAWFGALKGRLAEVDVDGEQEWVLAEDVDELLAARPTSAVRLLPGFDQYVLGATTSDPHVVSPARRTAVSRQSGWIAPVVISGGVVTGTWEFDGAELRVSWFGEAGEVPTAGIEGETRRLSSILDRDLSAVITIA